MDTKSLAKKITKRLVDGYYLWLDSDKEAVLKLIEEELERGEYKEGE